MWVKTSSKGREWCSPTRLERCKNKASIFIFLRSSRESLSGERSDASNCLKKCVQEWWAAWDLIFNMKVQEKESLGFERVKSDSKEWKRRTKKKQKPTRWRGAMIEGEGEVWRSQGWIVFLFLGPAWLWLMFTFRKLPIRPFKLTPPLLYPPSRAHPVLCLYWPALVWSRTPCQDTMVW